jgi:SAM-dependent methyltransferase
MSTAERDYILGTHDDEVMRLGLQHRVWRPRALDAWRRAGFNVHQTLLDLGCGPGFATQDLAEIVGPRGRVVAVDRSRRFLDVVDARRLGNVSVHELDLDEGELPRVNADGAWVRWVFAFVQRPRDLLVKVGESLKRGGALVVHEYFDYRTWRISPRSSDHEAFVDAVMKSWRATGGEPDIGFDLPRWLTDLGFEIRELRPIIDVITPSNFIWQWPKAFVGNGLARLVDLGNLTKDQATRIQASFDAAEAAPNTIMTTPAVMEIIAVKR